MSYSLSTSITADPLAEYLKNGTGRWRERALTARSYRNVDRTLSERDTNETLATYGDALLKLALCELLLDRVEELSEEKKRYESDRALVCVIAKHYDILPYLRFDRGDQRIPKDYALVKRADEDNYKYIATAVEALLGAYYKETSDYGAVLRIVACWRELVDGNG